MRLDELIHTRHRAKTDSSIGLVAEACSSEATELMQEYGGSTATRNIVHAVSHDKYEEYTIHEICTPTISIKLHYLTWEMQMLSCYPICSDPCGNYFCELRPLGQIVFFDHETGAIYPLASNLKQFLDSVKADTEDPDIYNDPDAVSWGDPDFKPEF